jgi:hypothetical protein
LEPRGDGARAALQLLVSEADFFGFAVIQKRVRRLKRLVPGPQLQQFD